MSVDFVTNQEIIFAAHRNLPQNVWNYLSGGAESETTMRRNRFGLDSLLSGHLKTGQWWSCQNRPMDWARDSVCSTSLPPDPASPFWFANCAGRI